MHPWRTKRTWPSLPTGIKKGKQIYKYHSSQKDIFLKRASIYFFFLPETNVKQALWQDGESYVACFVTISSVKCGCYYSVELVVTDYTVLINGNDFLLYVAPSFGKTETSSSLVVSSPLSFAFYISVQLTPQRVRSN